VWPYFEEAVRSRRVLLIRRIRGWVGAEPKRPRVATSAGQRTPPSLPNATPPRLLLACPAGDPEPQLRSSIRMACSKRFHGLSTPTAASQLSRSTRHCRGIGIFNGLFPEADLSSRRSSVHPPPHQPSPAAPPAVEPVGGTELARSSDRSISPQSSRRGQTPRSVSDCRRHRQPPVGAAMPAGVPPQKMSKRSWGKRGSLLITTSFFRLDSSSSTTEASVVLRALATLGCTRTVISESSMALAIFRASP